MGSVENGHNRLGLVSTLFYTRHGCVAWAVPTNVHTTYSQIIQSVGTAHATRYCASSMNSHAERGNEFSYGVALFRCCFISSALLQVLQVPPL